MTTHPATHSATVATDGSASESTHPDGRVLIRRAGIQDAATVRELLLELAEYENTADAVQASVDDWTRMLSNPAVVVLVARLDGRPVGYVSGVRQLNLWVGNDIFAMDDLYVRAEARDHGIGSRLMAALADYASHDQLLITWGVREDNDAGHRFYRRLGAKLRTKMVAAWRPHDYATYLESRSED
jgi:ribosomal protein S18 acetylase RimI-like enzyme